ncbi:UDP-N-acetylmuramate dehydrogenase [Arthrobacter castelli]|uniref:UDP-N-acetylmuramate dehydrogenase n=1 Tax=Arthrobacter castelli TaxID=271431 RepID=UPI0003F963D7|nr:UDP-N-acetylmuramate dehydrogenase [Arthrobacter castelli]
MTAAPVSLADLTTTAVGGPAARYIKAGTEAEIIDTVQAADEAGEPLLIVGGGSNLLVSDDGFDGTVVHIASEGYRVRSQDTMAGAMVEVQAGHNWDDFVRTAILHAWSGLESLSGIPGLTGATPVQNVGAYGAEVSQTLASIRTWDRERNAVRTFANADLQFAYRDSMLKRTTVDGSPRYVVLTVQFQLGLSRMSLPIQYAELARRLEVEPGERAKALQTRKAVLELRASKGMVLDPDDHDTFSTGSFFTNPVVDQSTADRLPAEAPRFPAKDSGTKLSAAWLIDQAGFPKGYGLGNGRASLSTKHTLAVTNRGNAKARDLLELARAVRDGTEAKFGIRLAPEPLLIGCSLDR